MIGSVGWTFMSTRNLVVKNACVDINVQPTEASIELL